MFTIITSCEKETITVQENAEMKADEIDLHSFESIIDLQESGIDIQSYMNSLSKQVSKTTKETVSQREEVTGLQFYSSAEEFPCSSLPTEDFEEANVNVDEVAAFDGPLNENSDNGVFSPGDILPGVEFSVTGSELRNFVILGPGFIGNTSNAFGPNSFNDNLIINFTTNNVHNISMNVLRGFGESDIEIEIFGNSGSLGITSVFGTNIGTYFGVQSVEPIIRIELEGFGELIDNLSFGVCDTDGDGVSDDKDPYPNSNMSETIYIDGCEPNIDNVFSAEGTTMMDEIDALVAEINEQYNGENYDELHRDFTRGIAKITYYWRKDRLITRGERSAISSCAWRANIPYFNDPT